MTDDIDVPDVLDLSGKTAQEAAEALSSYLREHHADEENVVLWNPDEREWIEGNQGWVVRWSQGSPYGWAICLCDGRSMYGAELDMEEGVPQVVGFDSGEFGYSAETRVSIKFTES